MHSGERFGANPTNTCVDEKQAVSSPRIKAATVYVPALPQAPAVLLLTSDIALADLVGRIVARPWRIERCDSAARAREAVGHANIQLVVLDDEVVDDSERGWLLNQIKRYLPGVALLYIAARHTDEIERRARSRGAHFYTVKPVERDHFGSVIKSFMSSRR